MNMTHQVVRLKNPMPDEDPNDRFIVVEDREERLCLGLIDPPAWMPLGQILTVDRNEVETVSP